MHFPIPWAVPDVLETEPLTARSMGCFERLPTLILTPHIAGVTHESNARINDLTISSILNVLEGQS